MKLSAGRLAQLAQLVVLCCLLPACSAWECNATTCSDGCCNAEGICMVGNVDRFCGLGARACQDCTQSPKGACGPEGKCCGGLGARCQVDEECCGSETRPGVCVAGHCEACKLQGEACASSAQCCSNRTCEYTGSIPFNECR